MFKPILGRGWCPSTADALVDAYYPEGKCEFWKSHRMSLSHRRLADCLWIHFRGDEHFEITALLSQMAAGEIPDGWERLT